MSYVAYNTFAIWFARVQVMESDKNDISVTKMISIIIKKVANQHSLLNGLRILGN